MKKLIQILFSLPLISAPIIGVVSCNGKKQNNIPEPAYSKNMASLKFMSQLLLSGRHENMNFNTNELLTTLITPQQGYGGIPTRFNYNGKVIDYSTQLSDYIGRLAPGLGSLEKNGSDVVGVYASYIMGMYNNDFYRNFAKNGYFDDTLSQDGSIGLFNKSNNSETQNKSMSILPGLNNNISLSKETSRKELAWGVQDTGPLTNFLLENGYDGAPAATIANTSAPFTSVWNDYINAGTNAGGYMFYNTNLTGAQASGGTQDNKYRKKFISELSQMKIAEGSKNKLELATKKMDGFSNSSLNVKEGSAKGSIDFNEVGAKLGLFSGDAYKLNNISKISGLLSNIANTESGTNILIKFIDTLLPIRDYDAGWSIDTTTITNIITAGTYMGFIPDFYDSNDGSIKKEILNVLGDDIKGNSEATAKIGKFKDVNAGIVGLGAKGGSLKYMFGDDVKNQANALNQAQILFKAIIGKYNKMSASNKTSYIKKLSEVLSNTEGNQHNFVKSNSGLIGGQNIDLIDIGKKINKTNNKHNLINLLSFANSMYKVLSTDVAKDKVFQTVVDKANSMDASKTANQVLITSLKNSDFLTIKTMLGVKNGKAKIGSAIDSLLKIFTLNKNDDSTVGSDVVKSVVSQVASGMDTKIKQPYESMLRHVVTDEDWKLSNPYENFTSVNDTSGIMSFTLDYNGIGDSSSTADKQTKKVDDSLLDNFNPYQSIYNYFTKDYDFNTGFKYSGPDDIWDHKRTSGIVLGKDLLTNDKNKLDDALIKYDGTGLLKDYKPVHHRYKVEWKNVGLENSPYWVMSKVDCFNVEGDTQTQFYNIY